MMQSSRICQVTGHQDYSFSHICTFQGCNLGSRWVCAECLKQQTHQHNQESQTHIMNKQELQKLLNQEQNNGNQNNKSFQVEIQLYNQQLEKLIQVVSQFMSFLQNCQKEIDDYRSSFSIQQQVDQDWFSLNNDQITQILNKQVNKQFQFNNEELQIRIQQITKQFWEIEQSILKNQQQKLQVTNNFSFQFIDHVKLQQNDEILTAQISSNEQYLAYGGAEKLCVIYDLCLNKQIKSIQLDQIVTNCQFSNDQQLLYVGCYEGYLYCIDIANNCKQIYYQYKNQPVIGNIKEIQHQVIITSHETDIIITNIQLDQQILKINNAHTKCILGFDYQKLNNVIVSGSIDKSIKLFDGQSGQILIEKQKSHDEYILKIQLINDNKLASLSNDGILKYWQVDYEKKELILLNQLKDENFIKNFDFIDKQEQIITICNKYFQIFDQDLKVVKQIEHSQNNDVKCSGTKQLNSMNYVIICGRKQFTVMRRLQKNQ